MWFVISLMAIISLYPLSEIALIIREKILEGKRLKRPRYRD